MSCIGLSALVPDDWSAVPCMVEWSMPDISCPSCALVGAAGLAGDAFFAELGRVRGFFVVDFAVALAFALGTGAGATGLVMPGMLCIEWS